MVAFKTSVFVLTTTCFHKKGFEQYDYHHGLKYCFLYQQQYRQKLSALAIICANITRMQSEKKDIFNKMLCYFFAHVCHGHVVMVYFPVVIQSNENNQATRPQ